jgi:hypothetical protein
VADEPASAAPTTRAAAKPAVPTKLGSHGRKLWRDMTANYQFQDWELVVLETAARQRDDIAALEQHLRDNGFITRGSQGQARLDQAVTEVRLARRSLARLLGELQIPETWDVAPTDESGDQVRPGGVVQPMNFNSRRARAAAEARWRRQNQQAGGAHGAASS